MARKSIGFIGVGRMGGRMARRLLEAGHDLTIYDTSADACGRCLTGGQRLDSLAAVGSACEIVFASLPTPTVVETVALGPRGKRPPCESSSTCRPRGRPCDVSRKAWPGKESSQSIRRSAEVSRELKRNARRHGVVPGRALSGVRPILDHLGKVFFCGTKPGMGQTMKLLNNMLSATALAISSEAVVMGVKAGLDPRLILDVLNAGTGRNSATADKFPKYIVPRTFNAGFAMGLFNKDLRLCLEEADALGVPMMVGNAVRQLYSIALASEGSSADITEVVKPVERWAGVIVGALPPKRRGK